MSPSIRPEPRVLVATGDAELSERLLGLLQLHRVASCPSPPTGLDDLLERSPAARLLIVGDVDSDHGALDLLAAVKNRRPGLAVLVLSSRPTIRLATEVIRGGAEDFVPIPYSEELLLKEVARILEAADLRDKVESLHRLVTDNYGLDRIVSRSSRMRPVLERARAAARSDDACAHHRGDRHRQGADRAGDPRQRRSCTAATRPAQLRGAAARPRGERAVRAPPGRLLRRPERSPRALRRRPPRHALPGRDLRAGARGAGQAPARLAGRRGPPDRRPGEQEGGRADHRRQQPVARRHGRRRDEAGPLLPPLRPRHRDARRCGSAATTSRSLVRALPGPHPRAGRRTGGERRRSGARAAPAATRSPATCASSRTCSRGSASRCPPPARRSGRTTSGPGCASRRQPEASIGTRGGAIAAPARAGRLGHR